MMQKTKTTKWFILIYLIVYGVVQLTLIFMCWNNDLNQDALGYEEHAIRVCSGGGLYPGIPELHDVYIQAPGYVNFILAPIYYVFHNVRYVTFLNLMFNYGILYLIYYLCSYYFFNKRIGVIAVFIYSLTTANLFAPTVVGTEVPYLFFSLLGFTLALNRKWHLLVMAGLCYALAYTIRPLVLAFLVPSILWLLLTGRDKNLSKIHDIVLLLFFTILPLFCLGIYTKHHVGYATVSSSTGGYNLLMTANDNATPIPNHKMYYGDEGTEREVYYGSFTYAQRDSIWKNKAVTWISQHPVRYITLCVERFFVMFNKDAWSVPYSKKVPDIDKERQAYMKYQLTRMSYSLIYYIIGVLFIVSLIRNRKMIFTCKGLTLLILLLGIGGTCLFPMEARYHYPYIWVISMWAALEISQWKLLNKTRRYKNNLEFRNVK